METLNSSPLSHSLSTLRPCGLAASHSDRETWQYSGNDKLNQADDLIDQLSKDLRAQLADNLYVQRDLRVYDRDSFWIIKPAERRLWSETAALNDADAVLCEHMEAWAVG